VADISGLHLLRYFGLSNSVHVRSDVSAFGRWCFAHCRQLDAITFSNESRLTRIEK
jgi:hypothetical protein